MFSLVLFKVLISIQTCSFCDGKYEKKSGVVTMTPANSIVLAFAAMVLRCWLLVYSISCGQTIVRCFS